MPFLQKVMKDAHENQNSKRVSSWDFIWLKILNFKLYLLLSRRIPCVVVAKTDLVTHMNGNHGIMIPTGTTRKEIPR